LIEEIRATNGAILFRRAYFLIYVICFAAYFLSPIDLIPEVIFGVFGFVDDIMVGLYAIVGISGAFYSFLVERNRLLARA
jgi:uncharacterized membrane protein YkvA (DUF1232 family)